MSFVAPRVLDSGLLALTIEADTLHICTEPVMTYDDVIDKSIANKLPITISEPSDSENYSGRNVTVAAFSDGIINKTGMAIAYALIDSARNILLASGLIQNPILLHEGNIFTLETFTIGIPSA